LHKKFRSFFLKGKFGFLFEFSAVSFARTECNNLFRKQNFWPKVLNES
jgi:hypothetical protein